MKKLLVFLSLFVGYMIKNNSVFAYYYTIHDQKDTFKFSQQIVKLTENPFLFEEYTDLCIYHESFIRFILQHEELCSLDKIFPNVKALHFRTSSIKPSKAFTEIFLKFLMKVNFPSLEKIDLTGSHLKFWPEFFKEIFELPYFHNLQKLILRENHFSLESIVALSEAIENGLLPDLTHLDLLESNLKDNEASLIIRALASRKCPRLKVLNLTFTNLTSLVFKLLGEALMDNALPQIEEISLTRKRFLKQTLCMKADLNVLVTALNEGNAPYLTNLNLSHQLLEENTLIPLMSAFRNITNLRTLNFNYCDMKDQGLSALSSSIAQGYTKNLKNLYLNGNNLTDSSIKEFTEALTTEEAPRLEKLSLVGNELLTEVSLHFIASLFESGHFLGLQDLNFFDCPLLQRKTHIIEQALTYPHRDDLYVLFGRHYTKSKK